MYKKWKSGVYELKDVYDSMIGSRSKRIVLKASNSVGLTYRRTNLSPSLTPKDCNCLLHAMGEQLTRVGRHHSSVLAWSEVTSEVTSPPLRVFATVNLLIMEAGIVTWDGCQWMANGVIGLHYGDLPIC